MQSETKTKSAILTAAPTPAFRKPRVHLMGGDQIGWAIDDDLQLTSCALNDVVERTSLEDAEVVHCVWWQPLMQLTDAQLAGKRIICHIPNRFFHYMTLAEFARFRKRAGKLVAICSQMQQEMKSVGVDCDLIPYTICTKTFTPLVQTAEIRDELRDRFQLPKDAYLIGNFHRDTEGRDLATPKFQKGPDIFLEIVSGLAAQGVPVHVVLAGPRRHWLRQQLRERNLPVSFVGTETAGDDLETNILPREELNLLYNALDVYLVSSRWEGGPRSLMEASAAHCRVLSTRVGLAEDILEPGSLYDTVPQAVELLKTDYEHQTLADNIWPHFERVLKNHRPTSAAKPFQQLYENLEQIPVFEPATEQQKPHTPSPTRRFLAAIARRVPLKKTSLPSMRVCMWHQFQKPPWGGGNQFMMALKKGLEAQRISVMENSVSERAQAYLLNSIHFDVDPFQRKAARYRDSYHGQNSRLPIVHRIDGPIHLYRGKDRALDERCFQLNQELASATVVQSAWTLKRITEMGYELVNPVIIRNTVDDSIFNSIGRIPFNPNRKIRLISTCWSDNPRKGGPFYKWIEKNLDWNRFEYTFVGRASENFDRINHLPATDSGNLANILRQHDIYITASQNDPCSNAVVESLSCGLPVLYLNQGGHPELVDSGGLPFHNEDDFFAQLEQLTEHYEMFQRLIVVPTLAEITTKYLELLREVAR